MNDINSSHPAKNKYPKAPPGKRFLASLLDGLITTALAIPAIISWANGMTELFNEYNENGAVPLFYLGGILCLIPLAYGLIKDGLGKGQSWGKKMLGLMVVYLPDNAPCSRGDSFVRSVIGAIPVVGWFVEPVMVLATADGRRLADKTANTQVIEKRMFLGAMEEIRSVPSKWQLAPGETRYSSDQVIAYLKGKNDGIRQDNVNKTVKQTNLLVEHLISAGFHPVAAYIKIDDWDRFTIMVTVPDEEWCDPRFLPVFDYVFDVTERTSSDLYNLEILFCGLPDDGALNEPYVFSDGFILKLNVK